MYDRAVPSSARLAEACSSVTVSVVRWAPCVGKDPTPPEVLNLGAEDAALLAGLAIVCFVALRERELEHGERGHRGEHVDRLHVLDAVVLQVEHRDRRALEQVQQVVARGEVVVGDLQRGEVLEVRQVLQAPDEVVR